MLSESDLTEDQQEAIDVLYERDATFLYAPMGSGKTVVALTAVQELMRAGEIKRPLIVGTKKVCESVWPEEPFKWGHLAQKIQVAHFMPVEFGVMFEMLEDHDNWAPCINNENLPKLLADPRSKMFDALVIDEVSKYKAPGGKTFKALRRARKQFKWVVGMTGTPASEDWTAIYAECLIIDGGKTFGRNKEKFLREYFYPTDFEQRNWEILPGSEEKIAAKLNNLMFELPDYRDELPDLEVTDVEVPMTADQQAAYADMAGKMAVEIDGKDILADTAAVKTQKLQQIAAGFIYSEDPLHGRAKTFFGPSNYFTAKAERAASICCDWRAAGYGGGVLLVYWFEAEKEALRRSFGDALEFLSGPKEVERWNSGDCRLLAIHPASAGHGLNLARGGSRMIWLTPCWSNDLYRQTIARLWRRGQRETVKSVNLLSPDTVDMISADRKADKEDKQQALLAHVRAVRKKPGA